MRNKVFMIIAAACIISGCALTKANKETALRTHQVYNASLLIPPARSSNNVMVALSPAVSTEKVFPDIYSKGKNIQGLDIASVRIESSDPSKKNLGMFKSLKMYLSREDGSNEVLIASNNSISPYAGSRVMLNVDFGKTVDVGYGPVKRKDVIGSMASLDADEMDGMHVTNADQAMAGKLAGVQVQKAGGAGATSNIIIRGGAASLTSKGGSPMYILDGMPIDNLSLVNPNDIESIDVLKDAAFTSMYGSRGSNGVIIVRTKSGNSDFKKNEGSLDNLIKGLAVRVRLEYVLRNPLRTETGLNASIDFK